MSRKCTNIGKKKYQVPVVLKCEFFKGGILDRVLAAVFFDDDVVPLYLNFKSIAL